MFCLDYYPHQTYLKSAEQFKIFYRRADRTLKDFLEEYHDKSIVIDVDDSFEEVDADIFQELLKTYTNFKLILSYNNLVALELIKARNIPFFFRDFVGTIDKVHAFMKEKPTDMYICEELGFSLITISTLLHNNNIKVRVIPNLCQSSCTAIDSVLQFFVRPEDIDIYSEFVDVFQLAVNKEQQAVVYKIYKQGYWAGPIKQIIPNFKDDMDSRFLMNHFGAIRINCGKRCLYRPDACNICHRFKDLSETLKANEIFIKKKRISD